MNIILIFTIICSAVYADVYMHNPRTDIVSVQPRQKLCCIFNGNLHRAVTRVTQHGSVYYVELPGNSTVQITIKNTAQLLSGLDNYNVCPGQTTVVGSNNRLDEEGRERNNANRLFDSQNNDRGGYNVGGVYYYQGSQLPIEWTNQHSCGGPLNHCEVILQYMCRSNVRDGATTTTIPENVLQCQNLDCNSDTRYGMHEDYYYYMNCKMRERNKGLFTADQNLKGNQAKYTRQNPGGTRRGYECPEERDHYPYWHPSPWRDLAIMTTDVRKCGYYERESQNVKGRGVCIVPNEFLLHYNTDKTIVIPNTKEECNNFVYPEGDENGFRGEWKEFPSHDIPAPVCMEAQFSRINHLGNVEGGYPSVYNWTIPEFIDHDRCVMRIRYNITTNEYQAWDGVNAENNKQQGEDAANLDISARFDFANQDAAEDRGYEFKNNPQVELFSELNNFKLQLAINTAQYGRTFQDRSHTFAVEKRPSSINNNARIYNINVRGKRGNIVQVYPAVEYDFVPNTMQVTPGDYVHFQWTGSNTNPQNNDGQGRKGTDRSNVVLQMGQAYREGPDQDWYGNVKKVGHWGRSYPENLYNQSFLGFNARERRHLALLDNVQFRGEMSELDDAGTYYDLGPKKVTSTGVVHFLSTRNNNFSNRSQKGRLIVRDGIVHEVAIGYNGGVIEVQDGEAVITVERGVFDELTFMRVEKWDPELGDDHIKDEGGEMDVGAKYESDFLVIMPEGKISDGKYEIRMKVNKIDTLEVMSIYRSTSGKLQNWEKVDAEFKDSWATIETNEGGVYVARSEPNVGAIAGIVVACVVVVAIIVVVSVVYLRMNPEKRSKMFRSFQTKV